MKKEKRNIKKIEFANFILNKDATGSCCIIKMVKVMTDSEKLDKILKILNVHSQMLKEHGKRLDGLDNKLNRVIKLNNLRS